ncbi:MAG: hypothetical protein J6Y93_05415 [Treponema sp.]|nr:hypothetical protein [Treponema sp.]
MKLIIKSLLAALTVMLVCSGCADVNGLHNQEAATVTFVFTNFPVADGSYSIPGDHNNWDNTAENITIKNGEGISSSITVTSVSDEFSLVKKNAWLRSWSKTDGGTIDGAGREGRDYARNFLAEGITLGSDVTVTIDGSTDTATVTVE